MHHQDKLELVDWSHVLSLRWDIKNIAVMKGLFGDNAALLVILSNSRDLKNVNWVTCAYRFFDGTVSIITYTYCGCKFEGCIYNSFSKPSIGAIKNNNWRIEALSSIVKKCMNFENIRSAQKHYEELYKNLHEKYFAFLLKSYLSFPPPVKTIEVGI